MLFRNAAVSAETAGLVNSASIVLTIKELRMTYEEFCADFRKPFQHNETDKRRLELLKQFMSASGKSDWMIDYGENVVNEIKIFAESDNIQIILKFKADSISAINIKQP
jgi:hypothetical protein